MSLFVDPLVSINSAIESGSDVFRSKTEMVCSTVSSKTRKSSLPRFVTMALVAASRTVTSNRTKLLVTEKLGGAGSLSCAHNGQLDASSAKHRRRASPFLTRRLGRLRSARQLVIPFAFHPDSAVFKKFLFPDRDLSLQPVDSFQCRLKRWFAVRGRDNHGNARFSDFQPPEAVDQGNSPDRPLGRDLAPDSRQSVERHRLIALVLQIACWPALRVVSDNAFEYDHGAIFSPL